MPFNGSGGFNRAMNWVADATAGTKIRADRHDQEDDNLASGLSNVICKDGQTTVTNHIPFNAKRLTNVADPVNAQDVATKHSTDTLLALKAPLADPVFTGNPRGPTPAAGDADTSLATTAFVDAAIKAGGYGATRERYYVANATWPKPTTLNGHSFKGALVELMAPGGGGGGAPATGATTACGGGGGGSGGHGQRWYDADELAASYAITVPSLGGAGGSNGDGAAGGSVAMGALCSATGGLGGQGGTPSTAPGPGGGGAGGVASISTGVNGGAGINGRGSYGLMGVGQPFGVVGAAMNGKGADSPYGGGGPQSYSVFVNGGDGVGYGSGGAGSANGASQAGRAGGRGAGGFIRVLEVF